MWNAEVYNRYGKERIQPSIDLVGRIREMKFQRILDVITNAFSMLNKNGIKIEKFKKIAARLWKWEKNC